MNELDLLLDRLRKRYGGTRPVLLLAAQRLYDSGEARLLWVMAGLYAYSRAELAKILGPAELDARLDELGPLLAAAQRDYRREHAPSEAEKAYEQLSSGHNGQVGFRVHLKTPESRPVRAAEFLDLMDAAQAGDLYCDLPAVLPPRAGKPMDLAAVDALILAVWNEFSEWRKPRDVYRNLRNCDVDEPRFCDHVRSRRSEREADALLRVLDLGRNRRLKYCRLPAELKRDAAAVAALLLLLQDELEHWDTLNGGTP